MTSEQRSASRVERWRIPHGARMECVNPADKGTESLYPPHWQEFVTAEDHCAAIERLKRELSAIYDAFQIGQSVRTLPILLTNISNARRRSDCLSGVEALFTVPADPDDEESINTCPLRWGAERDEYVRQFKAALTARAGRELAEARADLERALANHSADLSAERASGVPTATNRPGHISSTVWRAPGDRHD